MRVSATNCVVFVSWMRVLAIDAIEEVDELTQWMEILQQIVFEANLELQIDIRRSYDLGMLANFIIRCSEHRTNPNVGPGPKWIWKLSNLCGGECQ